MTTISWGTSLPAHLTRRWIALGAVLAASLGAGALVSWWVGAAVAALGTYLAIWPLSPLPAMVAAVAVATFVNNEAGHLTRELTAVTMVLGYALLCVAVAAASGRWKLPRAPLTTAILVFEGSTLLAAAHGILAGHNLRYLGLEALPLMAFTIALLVGGLPIGPRDLRTFLVVLNLASLGHVALGFASYQINGMRAGGIWFTPIPGIVALLLFNLALRREAAPARWGLILLIAANLLHQLISLTRGYWIGVIAGLVLSCALYAGRGHGVGARWRRIGGVLASLTALAILGAVFAGTYFQWGDLMAMFGTRLTSSVGTTQTSETASNFERVLEWVLAAGHIRQAPWFGHGLGFTMHVHYPIINRISTQWFLHQFYLLMWVKQGIVGLICLLATLFVAIRTGARNARRLEPPDSGWAAGAAAATVYVAALALTNFPMAQVNSTFLMVFLWGVALAVGNPPHWRIVWRLASGSAPTPPPAP